MSKPCKHPRAYYRDLLTGAPPERRCWECNELLPPKFTIADLEAGNARLQERVKEAERERDGIEQTMQDNADVAAKFEALAELRGEALVVARRYLEEMAQDNFTQVDIDFALVCEAIAMTPEQAHAAIDARPEQAREK